MRRWYLWALAALATAVPLQAAQPSEELHAVELLVTVGEHEARVITLEGSRARIVTTADETLELAVTVEPGESADGPRITLESFQILAVGPRSNLEQPNLLGTHLLEPGRSAIVFSGRDAIRAELLAVRRVPAPDADLRPADRCCIACPGGPSTCGVCVSLPCGSCAAPGCP